jgi:hypothetical protein
MKSKLLGLMILATTLSPAQITQTELSQIFTKLKKSNIQVAWEGSKVVTLDLDGKGKKSYAMVGVAGNKVYVAIIPGPINKKNQVDVIEFAIDPTLQKAICGLPAILETESLDFKPEDNGLDQLEDFVPSKKARGLLLSGGGCDPVHMYWSKKKRKIMWWRR